MTQQQRTNILFVAAICMLVLLFGDRLVITPAFNRWNDRESRINDLRQSVDQDQSLVDRSQGINRRWNEMLSRSLPRNEAEAEGTVLRSMNQWAKDSGVEVTTFKPKWTHDKNTAAKLDCQATASGSLKSLAHFLYALETSDLPLRTEEAIFSPQDDKAAKINLELHFTGLVLIEQRP